MTNPSLRRSVGRWLALPLAAILLASAFIFWQSALQAVNLAYDRSLRASINVIAESVHWRDGNVQVDVPHSALEIFSQGAQERIFYAVHDHQGKLLTGYPDLPHPKPAQKGSPDSFVSSDAVYRGDAVRVGRMNEKLYAPGNEYVVILFAETTEQRNALARELFLSHQSWMIALALITVALTVIALTQSFRPLIELRDKMRERADDDLSPIAEDTVPTELRPLIEAVNRQTQRIEHMLAARRRFLSDAAHQLKTPLTVLGIQADYGLRQTEPEEMQQALLGLRQTLNAAQRLTRQLLSLSRAETVNGLMHMNSPCDLVAVVRIVAIELAALALQRNIQIQFEPACDQAWVTGDETALREAFANVLDNALRYTPIGGEVLVKVLTNDESVFVEILDNGPGLSAQERPRVFERFYRGAEHTAIVGSGLGLPIALEVAKAHRGDILLIDGLPRADGGHGLGVQVLIPRSQLKPE